MKLTHNGETRTFHMLDWEGEWEDYPHRRAALEEIARQGFLTDDDGMPITGLTERRVRDRLLGIRTRISTSPGGGFWDSSFRPSRRQNWLIPGLWSSGTLPLLGGTPKSGKTTLLVELTAALVVPGYRFLDHFDPVVLTEEERQRGVWLVNAETHPDALEDALRARVPKDYRDGITVDHLEQEGGPEGFDLTDPVLYTEWLHRLVACEHCDGSDDLSPLVVLVDGLTAILAAAGKTTAGYGLWYAAFRRLMREAEVQSALVTGHSVMRGGHLMGGVEAQAGADGLWNYSASNPDDPKSKRWFSVVPRMGGDLLPRTRVVLNEDERLVLGKPKAQEFEPQREPIVPIRDRVLTYVKERNADGEGPSMRAIRASVSGRNPHVDAAVGALVAEGLIVVKAREGRGGGSSYWAT